MNRIKLNPDDPRSKEMYRIKLHPDDPRCREIQDHMSDLCILQNPECSFVIRHVPKEVKGNEDFFQNLVQRRIDSKMAQIQEIIDEVREEQLDKIIEDDYLAVFKNHLESYKK